MAKNYDVIVVGGGHAGCEAAAAAARIGVQVCLITQNFETIGEMSCNPSIGGVAKGIIVREIDAMGGLMGLAIDRSGIHYKMLNKSKGPAVWGPRAQADRALYKKAVQEIILSYQNLEIFIGTVQDLIIESGIVSGLIVDGQKVLSKSVVIATGTFLRGVMHIGARKNDGGRYGEKASLALAETLHNANLEVKRLKTGTPARIYRDSINWNVLERQEGDNPPVPFSDLVREITVPQIDCYLTHTTKETHKIVQDNLHLSSMYSGNINSIGPRYCPSIEDKIVKFAQKERHQIFLEPEGLNDPLVYPNGISTSLPELVQEKLIRSLPGLEKAKIARFGYAIEYDYVNPKELTQTLETRKISGLFLAGQINGTTGYEEAAGQGLIAGANAALKCSNASFITTREESYIGVMISDLISMGTVEPYRMMTSRAEFRISLRPENAGDRLTRKAAACGLVHSQQLEIFHHIHSLTEDLYAHLQGIKLSQEQASECQIKVSQDGVKRNIINLMSFPDFRIEHLLKKFPLVQNYDSKILHRVFARALYSQYESRQRADIDLLKNEANINIPAAIDYSMIGALSHEIQSKLVIMKPQTMADIQRIQGMTPTALIAIQLYINRHHGARSN